MLMVEVEVYSQSADDPDPTRTPPRSLQEKQHKNGNLKNWHDCSEEEGIIHPTLTFTNVYSDPAVVTKDNTQIIYKTISYNDVDSYLDLELLDLEHSKSTLEDIKAEFTQYYHTFNKYWTPFLFIPNLDMCKEHSNLCPLTSGDTVQVVTVHPPLNRFTPYGLYRSKQVYKDPRSGAKIGCVDMQFLYCEGDQEDSDRCQKSTAMASSLMNSNVRLG